jgi:arylsulfatase A-like enzyme
MAVARWMERFVFFGFGVFCTITLFYVYHVHTSSSQTQQHHQQQESSSFQPPNQLQDLYQQRQRQRERRNERGKYKESNLDNVQWSPRDNKYKNNKNNNTNDKKNEQPPPIIKNVRLGGSTVKATIDDNNNNNINGLTPDQKSNLGIIARIETVPVDPKIFETIPQTNHTTTTTTKDQNPSPKSDRLNIVLFYADDWTLKVLGKFDPNVKTPNIDKMADNGILFTNNCVTTSVCWMSRATLVTGVYYSRHLQHAPHSENMFRTNPWNETLFPKLKSAGYYTGMMGKWHSPQPNEEMDEAFDKRECYYGDHWFDWYSGGTGKMRHVTDVNCEHALKFLQDRPKDQNFALKVSFFATHAWDNHYPSYNPKNETRRQYYPDSMYIEPPKTATEKHWMDLPRFFHDRTAGRSRWKKRFEPDYFQANIKDLYSMATEVDDAVGQIVEELKKQNVLDNTLLIFTTDNGNLHGEHGLSEKWYPFEESIKVPLVIQDPRLPKDKRGKWIDEWTLNIDLAPTMLAAAGLSKSSWMQGRDIAELYLNDDQLPADWRQDWYYEWNMGDPLNASGHPQTNFIDAAQALITNEWKYIYWPEQNYEQLFHRSIDPYDEWDLIRKDNQFNTSAFSNMTGNVQTTVQVYETMKAAFFKLRAHVMEGKPV